MSETETKAQDTECSQQPSLMQELSDVLRQLPDKGLFLSLLGVWVVIFTFLGNSTKGYVMSDSLFVWMNTAYSSEGGDDAHGKLIPIVVLVLLWWKRDELLKIRFQNWWGGLVFLLVGCLLHVVAFGTQIVQLSIVAFFCGLYGLTGLVWGREWLFKTFFPFVLFAFAVPLGANGDVVTFPLRMMVTVLSVWFSNSFMGIEVVRDGSRIFDPSGDFQYDVAPACSGIRSLTALFLLATILAMTSFKSYWKRFVMMGLTVPIAILGNTARIVAVIIAAEAFGQDAGKLVHDWAWVFTYGTALGCIFGLSFVLNRKRRSDSTIELPKALETEEEGGAS